MRPFIYGCHVVPLGLLLTSIPSVSRVSCIPTLMLALMHFSVNCLRLTIYQLFIELLLKHLTLAIHGLTRRHWVLVNITKNNCINHLVTCMTYEGHFIAGWYHCGRTYNNSEHNVNYNSRLEEETCCFVSFMVHFILNLHHLEVEAA